MARRSRRRRHSPSKANPRSFSELRAGRIQEQDVVSAAQTRIEPATVERTAQTAPSQPSRGQSDWKVEYGRVFSDLKQLLIVSVGLFVLMIVVGLFL